jgi:UDP-glucuronate 4-epimerase
MNVLVTGAAGFIGYHLCERLLAMGHAVVGVDSLNEYYDPSLKQARLRRLLDQPGFRFERLNIADRLATEKLFDEHRPERVVNLAAQAGVRYSLENPHVYVEANVMGFLNVLEGSRRTGVGHLVYASSSSVYGLNTSMPFSVSDTVDHPVSLYAATKKADELMAHAYSHLYRLPTTGLRFFTVYGPWGRPDMALFKFTERILAGEPIDLYNHGRMKRDFTYVADVIEGVVRVLDLLPRPDPSWNGDDPSPASSSAPYRVFNIGNNNPEELTRFVEALEEALGRKARINSLPLQPGDVLATAADVSDLAELAGFAPRTSIEVGIARFVEWYLEYYGRQPGDPSAV